MQGFGAAGAVSALFMASRLRCLRLMA
jgi:hypothetical protein